MKQLNKQPLLDLLFRMLKDCEPFADKGVLRLSFGHEPNETEQKLLSKAGVHLKFDTLGGMRWVTAEMGNATVMMQIRDAVNSSKMRPLAPHCSSL
mgnify:CR=1 FL=1